MYYWTKFVSSFSKKRLYSVKSAFTTGDYIETFSCDTVLERMQYLLNKYSALLSDFCLQLLHKVFKMHSLNLLLSKSEASGNFRPNKKVCCT